MSANKMTLQDVFTLPDNGRNIALWNGGNSKWDVMIDKENQPPDWDESVEKFLQFGKRYMVTLTVEELDVPDC